MIGEAQAVLGSSATALVGMENASSSGHATNRGGMASRWLSPVLELALQGEAARWPKAVEPGDSGADLSYGCGEPHVGSTPHARRVAEAGLPFIAANGLTLASTSPEKPRCGQALADVFTKSSPRHCGDGLLHGTHDHLWCPVLLLGYQP